MKTRFACTACNHKFSRYEQPRLCPFCGRTSVEEYRPVTAEDILQELQ